jgi:hypothetical protein
MSLQLGLDQILHICSETWPCWGWSWEIVHDVSPLLKDHSGGSRFTCIDLVPTEALVSRLVL